MSSVSYSSLHFGISVLQYGAGQTMKIEIYDSNTALAKFTPPPRTMYYF